MKDWKGYGNKIMKKGLRGQESREPFYFTAL